MVSVMYGIGVQAFDGSDLDGSVEKHRMPDFKALRAGALNILVVNMVNGLMVEQMSRLADAI